MRALRTLLLASLVVVLLSPLAQLLRTQQPWTCFPLTFDESYYLQAIVNYADGRGFRTYQSKVFDPGLTVGVPMAWGTQWVRSWSGEDWPQAGRLWVYFTSFLLVGLLAWAAARRSRSVMGGVATAAIFGWALANSPGGAYAVYGILGEIPAALLLWVAYLLLDQQDSRSRFYAGVAGIASAIVATWAFVLKVSFFPALPSIVLGSMWVALFHRESRGRRGVFLWTVLALAVSVTAVWLWMAWARDESLTQVLRAYVLRLGNVSASEGVHTISRFFPKLSSSHLAIWALALALGFRKLRAGERAAWVFTAAGVLYFFVLGRAANDKHWLVFFLSASGLVALRVGGWLGPWLECIGPRDAALGVLTASVLVWVVNVPPRERRSFSQADAHACPVKEQRAVDRELKSLLQRGELDPMKFAVVAEFSSQFFSYELGWQPKIVSSWRELGTAQPRWVAGDLQTLQPWPSRCAPRWKGSSYALLECSPEAASSPAQTAKPAPRAKRPSRHSKR